MENTQLDFNLKQLYKINHSIHDPWHTIFVVLYTVVSTTAFSCNALLLLAIKFPLKKRRNNDGILLNNRIPHMRRFSNLARDKRDHIIAYLAGFDICLSLSMPLTAFDSLSKFWPFGHDTEFVCRLTKSFPSIMMFSASMMICIIAVNCYRQIVCWYKRQISFRGLSYMSLLIVVLATAMSSPIFLCAKLMSTVNLNTSDSSEKKKHNISETSFNYIAPSTILVNYSHTPVSTTENNSTKFERIIDTKDHWSQVAFCVQDWPFRNDPETRLYYSVFSSAMQLAIPFIVISMSYFFVSHHLLNQSHKRQNMLTIDEEAIQRENDRTKRRNNLMTANCMVFLVLWLPLNMVGILMDHHSQLFGHSTESRIIIFMSCHLIGMCSAIINPILYGYTQEHIKKGNVKHCLCFAYVPLYLHSRA